MVDRLNKIHLVHGCLAVWQCVVVCFQCDQWVAAVIFAAWRERRSLNTWQSYEQVQGLLATSEDVGSSPSGAGAGRSGRSPAEWVPKFPAWPLSTLPRATRAHIQTSSSFPCSIHLSIPRISRQHPRKRGSFQLQYHDVPAKQAKKRPRSETFFHSPSRLRPSSRAYSVRTPGCTHCQDGGPMRWVAPGHVGVGQGAWRGLV